MTTQDEKAKLEENVRRGTLAEVASRETLGEFALSNRNALVATLIGQFREGKTMQEMLNTVAELSAMDKLENDLRMRITRGNQSRKELERMNEQGHRNRYED